MAKLSYIPVRGEEITAEISCSTGSLVFGLERAGWRIVLALPTATILSDKTDRVIVH